jgi:hypothetical protein
LGFKLEEIESKLAQQRKKAVDFTSDTGKIAAEKRWKPESMPLTSRDDKGIEPVHK